MENEKPDPYSPLWILFIDLLIWWILGEVMTGIASAFLNVICLAAALTLLVIFVFESYQAIGSRNSRSGD